MITIVLIPVLENYSARKVCDNLENQTFSCLPDLHQELKKKRIKTPEESVKVYLLSDFMEAVNDEDMDVLVNYYMSYVNLETL